MEALVTRKISNHHRNTWYLWYPQNSQLKRLPVMEVCYKSWPALSFVINSGAQAIPLRPDQRTRIQCAWEPSPHQTGVCFYRLPTSWRADWKEWQSCGGRYRVSLGRDLYRQCWWLRSLSLCRRQRGRSLQVELYLWDQTFRFVSQHSCTLFLRRVDFKLLRINPGLVFWKGYNFL